MNRSKGFEMLYRAIVGVCFGSCCADLRQAANVEFEFTGRTFGGFRHAALQAARRKYPDYARLLNASDSAVVLMPFDVAYPILPVPRGIWNFDPQNGFTEHIYKDLLR